MNYTSIEQSKKLLELGLSSESADMQWFLEESYGIVQIKEDLEDWGGDCTIPCWSVGALIELMPKQMQEVKDHPIELIIGKPKEKWSIMYFDWTGLQHGHEATAEILIDACYKMVMWLLENGYIKS